MTWAGRYLWTDEPHVLGMLVHHRTKSTLIDWQAGRPDGASADQQMSLVLSCTRLDDEGSASPIVFHVRE